jgi:hypothetical protein
MHWVKKDPSSSFQFFFLYRRRTKNIHEFGRFTYFIFIENKKNKEENKNILYYSVEYLHNLKGEQKNKRTQYIFYIMLHKYLNMQRYHTYIYIDGDFYIIIRRDAKKLIFFC